MPNPSSLFQNLAAIVPLLATLLDAVAGVGVAFGWFNFTPTERQAIVTLLAVLFAVLASVTGLVCAWLHHTNVTAARVA